MGKIVNFIRVASEIVSGLLAVLGSLALARDITSGLNNKWQVFSAILVFVVLALWRMYEHYLRIKPKIEVKRHIQLSNQYTPRKKALIVHLLQRP